MNTRLSPTRCTVALCSPGWTNCGKKAKKKLKLERGFADYRQMLAEVKPDVVAVAPRHVDEHRDMTLAAIEAGAAVARA